MCNMRCRGARAEVHGGQMRVAKRACMRVLRSKVDDEIENQPVEQ